MKGYVVAETRRTVHGKLKNGIFMKKLSKKKKLQHVNLKAGIIVSKKFS